MNTSQKPVTMKMSLTFKYILTFSLFFCYFVYVSILEQFF